uniref:Uncharacterized protein MANES_05G012800 n=1 Tax=Rhizophora mucronata TaxID=61149 RepID=A0A2P2Q486_RHIMU
MLDHAAKLIEGMPFEPDVVLWGALLGACGLHSCLELGAYAVEGIERLKEDHPITYAMLSKIHGDRGQWADIIELRKMMKVRHVKKQEAGSWTESPLCIR